MHWILLLGAIAIAVAYFKVASWSFKVLLLIAAAGLAGFSLLQFAAVIR